MQFEYGEVGFNNYGRTIIQAFDIIILPGFMGIHFETTLPDWKSSAINFDLNDEVNARDAGYFTPISLTGNYNGRNVKTSWNSRGHTRNQKIQHVKNHEPYKDLPTGPVNNPNTERIKNSTTYMLPYRKRK